MNLQENINRIREVMGLREDLEEISIDDMDNFDISYEFDPKVVELQKKLKDLNFDLGNFGPNRDGVDGIYGPLTKAAHMFFKDGLTPSEFETNKETMINKANFYAVQGSWGWGGLKNTQEKDVREYYKKFASQGATIIEPPIGKIEPHGNKPVYKEIGAAIDSLL